MSVGEMPYAVGWRATIQFHYPGSMAMFHEEGIGTSNWVGVEWEETTQRTTDMQLAQEHKLSNKDAVLWRQDGPNVLAVYSRDGEVFIKKGVIREWNIWKRKP
jgi:hypothetical protein